MENNKFSIPGAIVIAGALIATAIFFSNKVNTPSSNTNTQQNPEINLRAPRADEHIIGNPAANVVLVEYSDTECPFCKQFHTTMHRLINEVGKDGTVAWVYRHFPIPQLHPKALKQSEALECAARLGGNEMFWKYTDAVYETTKSNNSLDIGVYNLPAEVPTDSAGKPYYTQKTPRSTTDAGQLSDIAKGLGLDLAAFENCLAGDIEQEKVQVDYQEAVEAGGRGTPYTIAIFKNKISTSAEQDIKAIASQLPADTLAISKDKLKLGISGALPYDLMKELLTIAQGR